MPRSRPTIDATGTRAKLDKLTAAVRREAQGAEADPFDDAMVEALVGIAEALKAQEDELAELDARLRKAARRALVTE